MRIEFDKKAKKYIKDKDIKDIIIQLDNDSKSACCGLGSVDFKIYINSKDKIKNLKKIDFGNIEIYYEPAIDFYFSSNQKMLIKTIGILNFKNLYVANEINVLK